MMEDKNQDIDAMLTLWAKDHAPSQATLENIRRRVLSTPRSQHILIHRALPVGWRGKFLRDLRKTIKQSTDVLRYLDLQAAAKKC